MCNINTLDVLLKEAYTELRKIFEKTPSNTFQNLNTDRAILKQKILKTA